MILNFPLYFLNYNHMTFTKGFDKNRNSIGRPKGKPNNAEVKSKIAKFIDENIDDLFKEIKTMESKDKAKYMLELMSYTLPKLRAIELEATSFDNELLAQVYKEMKANGKMIVHDR